MVSSLAGQSAANSRSLTEKEARADAKCAPTIYFFQRTQKGPARSSLREWGTPASRQCAVDTKHHKPASSKAAGEIGQAYSRLSSELKHFFARHSRRAQASDDLMQEVYLELLRYSPRDLVRDPQAYLYKIAWHVVNRSNARTQHEALLHEPQDLERIANRIEPQQGDEASAALNAQQQIMQALADLPPLYGAALILSRRDGLSYSQIARELKISVHTVRKYLTRAVAHLKNSDWDQ
jgi:RNA polymerase sigma factor (sigma-70 family)